MRNRTEAQKQSMKAQYTKAATALSKRHGHDIARALKYAAGHHRTNVLIAKMPALGVQQLLARETKCNGYGPYHWHQNSNGFWFISYEPS